MQEKRHPWVGGRAWLASAAVLALLLPAREAQAVIPSAFGPIQALLAILPQLLLALMAASVALFKPRTYKLLFAYLVSHKVFTAVLLGVAALVIWNPAGFLFGHKAAEEKVGAPWTAARGGPQRTGVVTGASGPERRPGVAWKIGPDILGATAQIQSSPAVVGNRVYFSVGNNAIIGQRTGSLCCADLETGALVWRWTGKGELEPPLNPIFSSPAVWSEQRAGEASPAVRYLVCGEGYHDDRNGRLTCLDLEPVVRSKGKEPPKLKWYLQATDHVESSPCLFDGKVYVGAGDDGLWCLDLETGRVVWRLESGPFYEVLEGPQVPALREKLGRTVRVRGPVRRFYNHPENKDDPGLVLLDAKSVQDHSGPGDTSQEAGVQERTVTGRVVQAAAGSPAVDHGSGLRIQIDAYMPDAESSPVGVFDGPKPRVLMGFGIDGQAVVCLDARTGELVWKTKTPYPAFGAAAVEGDRVLIGMGNGSFTERDPHPVGLLLCLSLGEGKELWRANVGDILFGAVAVSEGQAFLSSRDGQVYVVDLAQGRLLRTLGVGAAMVGSPAVTHSSVYVGTEAGKLFCLDRRESRVRWSEALTPGKLILSSPAVSGGKLLVGTDSKGLVCLSESSGTDRPSGPARPWQGPGGGASRSGAADERGLPSVEGDKAEARPLPAALQNGPVGPLAASGDRVYAVQGDPKGGSLLHTIAAGRGELLGTIRLPGSARELVGDEKGPFLIVDRQGSPELLAPGRESPPWGPSVLRGQLALGRDRILGTLPDGNLGCLDLARGAVLWKAPPEGTLSGAPAYVNNLVLFAVQGAPGRLSCLNDVDGRRLWSVPLSSSPAQPVTVVGDRVFVVGAGKPPETSILECRSLYDGAPLWRRALGKDEGTAISPVVASGDYAVVATSEEKVLPFSMADGTLREPIPVGGAAVMPGLLGELLVVVGESRIGIHDLSTHQFPWKFGDEDDIGTATGPPVVAGGILWVGTSKKGLVSIGPRGSPAPP